MRELLRATPHAPAWSDADWTTLEWASVTPPQAAQPIAIQPGETRPLPGRRRLAWLALGPEPAGIPSPAKLLGFAVASLLHTSTWAECELEYIVTAPDAQLRGIGALLLQHVLDWARTSGAHTPPSRSACLQLRRPPSLCPRWPAPFRSPARLLPRPRRRCHPHAHRPCDEVARLLRGSSPSPSAGMLSETKNPYKGRHHR